MKNPNGQMGTYLLLILGVLVIQTESVLRSTDADVNEGPCTGYPPLEKRLPFFLQPEIVTQLSRPFTALITYGSVGMFRTYAESFLGRGAVNEDELKEMCVTILCSGSLCTQIGYKNKVYFSLGHPGSAVMVYSFANPLAMSPGVIEIPYEDGVVWSTKDHYLLSRCVNGQFKDWKLMSMAPITMEVKAKVLDVIEGLGFNRSLALDLSPYCEKPSVSQAAMWALEGLGVGTPKVSKNVKEPIWLSFNAQNRQKSTSSTTMTTQLEGRLRKNVCNFVKSHRAFRHRSHRNFLGNDMSPRLIQNAMGVMKSMSKPMAASFPSLVGMMTRMSFNLFNFVDTCKTVEEYHTSLIDPIDPFIVSKCEPNRNGTAVRRSSICRRLKI